MSEIFTPFDPADYLKTDEAILSFLSEAFSSHNPKHISNAIGVVMRAKGMTEMAKRTGFNRESLYHAFSEKGNPTLRVLLPVLDTLGVNLTVSAQKPTMNQVK